MIVLSVGMPRAGSGWYYNLTNDLMLAGGAQDAHQIRQRYRLQGILTEVNCNIAALPARRLLAVLAPPPLRVRKGKLERGGGPTQRFRESAPPTAKPSSDVPPIRWSRMLRAWPHPWPAPSRAAAR